ncbi:MAG: hypothetical protein A2Y16_06980 [Tenericutes bacterium GWF2_57_13]|nr:MAG: hypothetical protein A2Y16_06980 [Tenericutes bacterium GWF2_57_13]
MTILYAILAFMFGTLFASFAEVVSTRLSRGETIGGKSRCPTCGHTLRLVDVFPLFGYAVNGGKCHYCKAPIPILHPLAELLGGLLFAASYLVFGLTIEFAVSLVSIVVLLCASLSDMESQTVYDRVWIVGLIPLLVLRLLDRTILAHLFAAGLLFTVLYLIALLGEKLLKKEALGGGDVKLFIFIGFVLTWDAGLLALFFASFLGFLFGIARKRKGAELPFVPFLFAGVVIAHFAGADIITWYLRLLGA